MKKSRQIQSDKKILKIDEDDGIYDNYGYDDTTDHSTDRSNLYDIEKEHPFVDLKRLKSHQKSQAATSDKKSLLKNAEYGVANEDSNCRKSEQRPVSVWSMEKEQSYESDDNDDSFERRTLRRLSFYDTMKKSRQIQSDKEFILKIDKHDGINDNHGYDDTTDHSTDRSNLHDIEKEHPFVDLKRLKSHQKSQAATSDKKSLLKNAEYGVANEDSNCRKSEQRPVSVCSIEKEQSYESDDNDDSFERRTLQRSSFYDNMKKLSGSYKKHIKRSDPVQHSQAAQCDENNLTNVGTAGCSSNIAQFQCFECVQAIPVSNSNGINPGDHVLFKGVIYDHHGIITSKNGDEFEIMEATNTFCGAVLGLFFGGKAKIKSSKKKFDFKRQEICVVRYSVQHQIEQIISDAESIQEGKYKYNVLKNNCEHFATLCVTGKKISVQVSKVRLAWKLFWSSGFVGLSDDMKRNEKAKKKNLICENCYEMNKKLLSVEKIPIKFKKDIEIGDIIQYTYWNLWHEAVVLSIEKPTKDHVVCEIAHFAFCGLFSHRKIKAERKEIQLNGKCFKLNYTAANYNVFEPDQVVSRATKRIGENGFFFFSNDSSHFARWCKLKRFKQKELKISSEELLA